MTIQEALAEGKAILKGAGIEAPGLDASLLLAEALKTSRSALIAAGPAPLPDESLALFRRFLERRRNGECAAYILGRKEFWGLDFTVNSAVLVPRPDTETLVEAALARIDLTESAFLAAGRPVRALDLCTGSGAAAVALKHERPGVTVYASDISPAALNIAGLNIRRLLGGAVPAITLLQGDLFDALTGMEEPAGFDIITANPPYVPEGLIDTLAAEVRGEPRRALDGGADGLALIRRIIAELGGHLNPGGFLLMEAGPEQMAAITGMLENHGFRDIQTWNDLAGRKRVIGGALA